MESKRWYLGEERLYILWIAHGSSPFRALTVCVVLFACYWAGTFFKALYISFVTLLFSVGGYCFYMRVYGGFAFTWLFLFVPPKASRFSLASVLPLK